MRVRKILRRIKNKLVKKNSVNKNNNIVEFQNSYQYWVDRYETNGDSGSGSYGRLAHFKAKILNDIVKNYNITTIVELGCGDGNQLTLAKYPNYTGYDISPKAIEICKAKFKKDKTKNFHLLTTPLLENEIEVAQLTISLDVIFHLIEERVFSDYLLSLFKSSKEYVVIYSSNENKLIASHVESRKFTDWIDKNIDHKWVLIDKVKNDYPYDVNDPHNTSIADFYIYKWIG